MKKEDRSEQLTQKLANREVKAIIFDFDGTLLDVRPPLRRAVAEVLDKHCIYVGPDMDRTLDEVGVIMEAVQGTPMPKIILQAHEIFSFVTVLDEYRVIKKLRIATEIFSKYGKVEKDARFFPGVADFLKATAGDFDLFVVSHSKTETVLHHLEVEGVSDLFSGVYGSDAIPAMKPDPAALAPVLAEVEHLRPDQLIVVGDMPTDLEVGQHVGAWTVGVTCGIGKAELLADCEPDLIIEEVSQLGKWIGGSTGGGSRKVQAPPTQQPASAIP
ncbi:MAG: HAD family hydrolase [Promethearchaeota archaeon]